MRVKCIEAVIDNSIPLKVGKIYTVLDARDDCLWLKGVEGGWARERFELVSEKPKEGVKFK